MRTANKNKQHMYYALQTGREEIPVYENGEIKTITVDGEIVAVGSGSFENAYAIPVPFMGNISFSGGDSVTQEFGVDITAYDAILVVDKGEIPITETSLIWYQTEPTYTDTAQTHVNAKSADYKVVAIKPSLNQLKAVLSRITK